MPRIGGEEITELGATVDDAAGEAYDKVARLLGLPFPGGPPIDRIAREGNPHAIEFPRGMRDDGFAFSFSGLKTAVARWVEARQRAGEPVPVADVAASFQEAVVDVLTAKAVRAAREQGVGHIVIGGGVAANSRLRALAEERCAAAGLRLRVPRPGLCTDNGAMVAALGAQLVAHGATPSAARPAGRLRAADHRGAGAMTDADVGGARRRGRLDDLVAYVDAHADPSALIFRAGEPDPRVVVIDPSGRGCPTSRPSWSPARRTPGRLSRLPEMLQEMPTDSTVHSVGDTSELEPAAPAEAIAGRRGGAAADGHGAQRRRGGALRRPRDRRGVLAVHASRPSI